MALLLGQRGWSAMAATRNVRTVVPLSYASVVVPTAKKTVTRRVDRAEGVVHRGKQEVRKLISIVFLVTYLAARN